MQDNDDEREGPWRKILLSGGALLGVAAAYNAFARKGVDELTNLIGGEEGGFDWRDRRVAFTKRGHGPPILLIHGIHPAAWSYEWRSNVDALARTNTVYTIDLLGFGMSTHLAIPFLGLALIDNSDPERLARACAEEGRNEFMFTATPLRLVGATGAPAHPLAIF